MPDACGVCSARLSHTSIRWGRFAVLWTTSLNISALWTTSLNISAERPIYRGPWSRILWSLYLQGPDMSIRKKPWVHPPCLQSPTTDVKFSVISQQVFRISQITINLYDLCQQGTQTFPPPTNNSGSRKSPK